MAPQTREDHYYEIIHKKTWSRRTAGFLGGATLFAGLGAGVGAIISFMPPILEALGVSGASAAVPSLAIVASNMALFAGAGSFLGVAAGGYVGASSGAAAAGVEETEKLLRAAGANIPEKPAEPKTASKLFKWKTAVVTGALFAVFGALIALNPLTASTVALMGFAHGSAAASITSAAAFSMFGAMLALNVPELTHRLSAGYRKILKGKIFEKESDQAPEKHIEIEKSLPPQERITEVTSEPTRANFASKTTRTTLANILEKTEKTTEPSVLLR